MNESQNLGQKPDLVETLTSLPGNLADTIGWIVLSIVVVGIAVRMAMFAYGVYRAQR